MSEHAVRIRWGAIGFGAFLLLMGVEIATESEPIPLGELLAEALKTGVIVVAATGVSLLTGRLQTERDEKAALSRDLEMARVEGAAWRERAQGYVSGSVRRSRSSSSNGSSRRRSARWVC